MPGGVRYYGFGERTGVLEKRGRRYTCWTTDEWRHQGPTTDSLYIAIPFFLGLDEDGVAAGVFLNNTFRTAFDLTDLENETLGIEADGGELDVYVFAGPEPAQVLERFTAVVGRMPLPPLWALGYHQSRWGYESAEEVFAVARELRERLIPADAIHLDLDHMDGARSFTWDAERFPDPQGLVRELGAAGFRVVCIVGAGIKHQPEGGYEVYDSGHERRVFLRNGRDPDDQEFTAYVWPGSCVFPDHVRPDVREWWGGWYAPQVGLGVAGFLNDMNEPAMHDLPYGHPESENTEPPPDLPHGPDDEPATHAEVRNVYAYLEDLGTYEALRRHAPDVRPFLLTRAGFAGVQRYAGAWTGDTSSMWEHLEGSLPQIVNLGLSGMPFTGADIGGFFGDCGPELLVRWTQLGALTPLARNHSAEDTAHQEPWVWGDEVEAACRRAIELRYRLLPYLYSLFEEAARTGAAILRPLFFHYADDRATDELSDEALLGRDLLLAPALHPGQLQRAVYLPAGTWTDLRSAERHTGPGWILASCGLDEDLPLFVRGGAVLPTAPLVQWTDERPLDPLTLEVFPDEAGDAEGRLYEDDGHSFAYERGESCVTTFTARTEDGRVVVRARRNGAFEPQPRRVRIVTRYGEVVRDDAADWEEAVG
jgi:alpha-glucosidase